MLQSHINVTSGHQSTVTEIRSNKLQRYDLTSVPSLPLYYHDEMHIKPKRHSITKRKQLS